MILAIVLVSLATGALAGAALVFAWCSGALEDERARAERLEAELLKIRADRAAALLRERAQADSEATGRLLADVRGSRRKGAHRA